MKNKKENKPKYCNCSSPEIDVYGSNGDGKCRCSNCGGIVSGISITVEN